MPCSGKNMPCSAKNMLSTVRITACPAQVWICPAQLRICPAQVRICPAQVRICPAQLGICPGQVRICSVQMRTCPAQVRMCLAQVGVLQEDDTPWIFKHFFQLHQSTWVHHFGIIRLLNRRFVFCDSPATLPVAGFISQMTANLIRCFYYSPVTLRLVLGSDTLGNKNAYTLRIWLSETNGLAVLVDMQQILT